MGAGTSLQGLLTGTWDAVLTDKHNMGSPDQELAMFASGIGTPPTTANVFSHGCIGIQTDSGTGVLGVFQNTGSSASPVWTLFDTALPGATASKLIDTNSVTALDVGTTASAVNNLRVTDAATGNAPILSAVGSDTNIGLTIIPKGTGVVTIGLATGTGDILLGSSSGTQTVKISNGAGIANTNIAATSVAGSTTNIATAATGASLTDTVNLLTGNAVALGAKKLNILTGTPGTSGNNQMIMGGGSTSAVTTNAVQTQYFASNMVTGSANANAPTATLTNAAGVNITVATGLRVTLTLGAGLQAGANTFNLNGAGAASIKLSTNPATDLGTAYATGGVIDLFFNGTVWLAIGGQ